jgi:hypothetical protein
MKSWQRKRELEIDDVRWRESVEALKRSKPPKGQRQENEDEDDFRWRQTAGLIKKMKLFVKLGIWSAKWEYFSVLK